MASVIVSNIDPSNTEASVREFFSFCGKVQSIRFEDNPDDESKIATITFEKKSAVETALLLEEAELGPRRISLKAKDVVAEAETTDDKDELEQEDKPRSAIFAEILSNGYILSDKTIEAGLDLDKMTGLSEKFNKFLSEAQDKRKEIDERYHVSDKLNPYLESAARALEGVSVKVAGMFDEAKNTAAGSRLYDFYSNTSKQVKQVREEARQLADKRQGKANVE